MKLIQRFILGAIAGTALFCFTHAFLGDDPRAICIGLSTWIPVSAVYSLTTIIILKRLGLAQLTGMMEACGLCIGLIPFLGLFPPYMWAWQLAILLISLQCASIFFTAFAVWIFHMRRQKN
jgi:uncharacterized membrane protein